MLVAALGMAASICAYPQICAAEMLISEAEGKLPPAPDTGMATRGLSRGPLIEQISPVPGTQNVNSPLHLKIKFAGRNNVAIDPANVKLTYMRLQAVDLTERVKSHLTKDGIDMAQADVPPGTHVLRLDVKDAEGRSTSTTITLSVAPK